MALQRTVFNQLINFFWTIVCFAGVFVYWYSISSLPTLFLFIIISLATAVIPPKYYQLSRHPKFYVRLGVKKILFFVQDGSWRK